MRQQLHPGVWLSTPEATPDEIQRIINQLVRLLREAHDDDIDISGLLSEALIDLAGQLPGGAREVIIHRNGSWEAAHIFRLAGGAD